MTDNKDGGLLIILSVIYFIGSIYLDYYGTKLERSMFFSICWTLVIPFLYIKYKSNLNKLKQSLLDTSEKWDFLYQDVWVPIYVSFACVLSYLVLSATDLMLFVMLLPLLLIIPFFKLILRNKLIIGEHKITYSKIGYFYEIEFRLMEDIAFDEDEGRIIMNYKRVVPSKYSFLTTKSEMLDIDEMEMTKSNKSIFQRKRLFKNDWANLKKILREKSEEYDFKFKMIYPA